DAQHLDIGAEAVAHHLFQRRVAAAVKDEFWVAAEEPRRVDAQREIAVDARFRAFGDDGLGVTVDPAAFHGARPASRVASTAGETARPPSGLARPVGALGLGVFGDDRIGGR